MLTPCLELDLELEHYIIYYEKAELLNSYFSSVFTTEMLICSPFLTAFNGILINTFDITEDLVLSQLCESKSAGLDGIHPKIQREVAHQIALPLSIIFDNLWTQVYIVPDDWKKPTLPLFLRMALVVNQQIIDVLA